MSADQNGNGEWYTVPTPTETNKSTLLAQAAEQTSTEFVYTIPTDSTNEYETIDENYSKGDSVTMSEDSPVSLITDAMKDSSRTNGNEFAYTIPEATTRETVSVYNKVLALLSFNYLHFSTLALWT